MTHESDRWDLSALFKSDAELEEALIELKRRAEALERRRERLDEVTPQEFQELLRELEAYYDLASRARAYAALRFYEDSNDESAQALFARVTSLLSELASRLVFFEVWWKSLPEEQAKKLLAAAGERYRYWLEKLLAWRPHTLSEEAERAVRLKDVAAKAHAKTYSVLNNRYRISFEVAGERVTIQRSELMKYTHHKDPAVRRAAYEAALGLFAEESLVLGELYRLVVLDWRNEYLNLRGFPRPISARNKMNDLPDEVVEALLMAVGEEAGVFRDYFRLKAKALGAERLSRYDLFAPLGEKKRQFSFDEALKRVEAAFRRFDPEFAELALKVVREGHIDVYPRPGKRSGAFSYGPAPGVTPYLLLNFQGEARDVATLAHELGHAVHSLLAAHHPIFTFHAPLPLAETASTFAELILTDALLAEEKDPEIKASIIAQQLENAYATIARQAYFARFEMKAHDLLAGGSPLAAVHEAYFESLKEHLGDAVTLPEAFRYEWLMVPHFYHTPFYVYAYAFGQLLVFSLYQRYREEGPAFVPRLKKILSAGGSAPPAEILAEIGFDISKVEFWRRGFLPLKERVAELEELLFTSR